MIYKISRASDWYGDKCPFRGAVLKGKDDWKRNRWEIEINCISDFNDIIRESGEAIMIWEGNIVICDDYIY